MDFSILVVTHNHSSTIVDLIESLERFSLLERAYFCDAKSRDGTLHLLQKATKNILVKTKLEGFSKNNNDLIKHFNLKSQYYVLLNPDTKLVENIFHPMIHYLHSNAEYGIGAPLLIYPNGEIQKSWKRFPSPLHFILKRLGIRSIKNEPLVTENNLNWALGACLVISNKLIKNNNQLLDERYRLYCEDIDICVEALYKGFKIKGFPELKLIHSLQERSSQSIFSKYNYWNIQSALKFIVKWNIKYLFLQYRFKNSNIH